jgi:type II secretory pathway pseudopilin PulG
LYWTGGNLWNDERGADTIPLKLIVYLAIVGIIIVMIAIGLKNAQPPMDTAIMDRQIEELKSSIEIMQTGYSRPISDPQAPAGNIRSFELVLPDSLEYISFGVDPDPDNNGILRDTQPGLITDEGDVVYFKLRNTGKILVKLDEKVHIREGILNDGRWTINEPHQGVVLTGNSQSVVFEQVNDGGIVYTISHLTDDLNAYINPDTNGGVPHGILLSTSPVLIPANNESASRVTIQIIDNTGKNVQSEGHLINLSSNKGYLSNDQIITSSHGSGSLLITSDELGLGLITAQSPGLHEGTTEIVFTVSSVEVEFNEWIKYSPGEGDPSELIADFFISHNSEYNIILTGWGTEAHWPLSPEGWPIGRIEVDGMMLGEREVDSGSRIDVPYGKIMLDEGLHTIRVTMTNDLNIPLIGDRNLFVEKIELS